MGGIKHVKQYTIAFTNMRMCARVQICDAIYVVYAVLYGYILYILFVTSYSASNIRNVAKSVLAAC